MSQIAAGSNLTIDLNPDRWRLLANGDFEERVLLEAAPGQPLRYPVFFGQKRRLPDTGALPTDYVQRVVLGWSRKDESWHLGLMLEPELAEPRGSRWCEIAHWPDPDADLYLDIAAQAGQGLARTINRPFNLIPRRVDDERQPPPPRPLPPLPIALELWTLEQTDDGALQLRLSGIWARSRIMRILWYTLWTAIFFVLSITTLRGGIALPRPEFLPYLGLASGAALMVMIVVMFYQLLTRPTRLVIDPVGRRVLGLRGRRRRWVMPVNELQAVYVSQVVSRRARRHKRNIHYGELNLHRADGRFFFLLNHSADEVPAADSGDENTAADGVSLMTPEMIASPLQAAAAHIARALDLPCFYDQRVR